MNTESISHLSGLTISQINCPTERLNLPTAAWASIGHSGTALGQQSISNMELVFTKKKQKTKHRMWSNTGSSTCLNPHVHWNQTSSSVYEPWRLCNSSLETRRFLSRTNLRKWTGVVKYFNWPAPPPPAVPTDPLTLPLGWPNAAGLQQLSVCLCFVYELILNTLADGGMRFAGWWLAWRRSVFTCVVCVTWKRECGRIQMLQEKKQTPGAETRGQW